MLVGEVDSKVLANLSTLERVSSSLSLIGICFILITYGSSRSFHKPINRLVFYASLGNIFTNIATLISRDAILSPHGGLCQMQAFLIQMFMPADAYWTLAMACNVYLTFYRKYDAQRLRKLEPVYFLCCYGLPFIPAVALIGIKNSKNGRMYGNATLWCWIATSWDKFRIALFYGPVWVAIFITFFIYARAGKDIWKKRQQLRGFQPSSRTVQTFTAPPPRDPFPGAGILQTTQIVVDHESTSPTGSVIELTRQSTDVIQYPAPVTKTEHSFTTQITSHQSPVEPSNNKRWTYVEKANEPRDSPPEVAVNHRVHTANEANTAIWSYTKVSLLFFFAMMITWIPSSANRVYSAVQTGQVCLPLEYASAIVLPLQGFWNAIIYTTTSLQACKEFWADIRGRSSPVKRNLARRAGDDREHYGADRFKRTIAGRRSRKTSDLFIDTSSETELQPQTPKGEIKD